MCIYVCVCIKTEKIQSFKYVKYMVTYTETTHLSFCTKKRSLRHPRMQLSERHNFKSCEENLRFSPGELLYMDRCKLLHFLTAFCIVTSQCIPPLSAPLSHLFTEDSIAESQKNQLTIRYLQIVQSEQKARWSILERTSLALGSLRRTWEKSQAKNKSRRSKTSIPSALRNIGEVDCF